MGALVTFFVFVLLFKRNQVIKFIVIGLIGLFGLNYVFTTYSDNLAVRRLTSTLEMYNDSEGGSGGVKELSGSRAVEIETILKEMNTIPDYLFGKGFGYTYMFEFGPLVKMNANAHFSPIALLSKYGLFLYHLHLRIHFVCADQESESIYSRLFNGPGNFIIHFCGIIFCICSICGSDLTSSYWVFSPLSISIAKRR